MRVKNVISIVLNCNLPFVRHPEVPFFYEEIPFYSSISDTIFPLLNMMEKLTADNVPFKIGLVISPTMCSMLQDELLISRYFAWLERQISFGVAEINRTKKNPKLFELAAYYHGKAVKNKSLFKDIYKSNIPAAFAAFQKKGMLELICAPATNCFLPFYKDKKEAMNALFETGIMSHNLSFHSSSNGIYLPLLGWHKALDQYLIRCNINWSIIETHGALLAMPIAKYGSFYPIKTKNGTTLFVKDYYAYADVMYKDNGIQYDPAFLDFYSDAVDNLPKEAVKLFLNSRGIRIPTGFKYTAMNKSLYNPQLAIERAVKMAEKFLCRRAEALANAYDKLNDEEKKSNKKLLSLCVWDADFVGRFWHEGYVFLENLFRLANQRDDVEFMTPSQYLEDQSDQDFQIVEPEYSSTNINGYGETLIEANNDWACRHIARALDRMTEMSERFKDESGIRERCLNQAAREVLLALSSDWPRLMSEVYTSSLPKWKSYAKKRLEEHLRNFTTIYESLGSNYLNTKFLTELENRNNIFPDMNYRVFQRNR
ncbi:MAG: DUF1957 domain-containing protein [Termitinemataceae bacterium]|nr:MAG: DUF1957 domain-containing protein [Termitinemataceae bacterium]